jgi:hypothetical protein
MKSNEKNSRFDHVIIQVVKVNTLKKDGIIRIAFLI